MEVGNLFLTYKAWFKTHHTDLMDDPQSSYRKMKKEVENFNDKFEEVLAELDGEDKKQNLFTLEDGPASIIEFPQFGGKDSQCYFK